MEKTYMLSAKKVKQHGFTSTQWTTKDKIRQYKGLISLYTRDLKITTDDNVLLAKRQAKELHKIEIQIKESRKKFDNAMGGDKDKLRLSFAGHKRLQLMCQNASPEKIHELLQQINFKRRKTRDSLRYRMKLKSERLIDLKLGYDRLDSTVNDKGEVDMVPSEKSAYVLNGKVQDAILKKEAAIYIRKSYRDIIAVMKKDAIYFEAVLSSLINDGHRQGNCMLGITIMGQRGAEYLDDRRQECKDLEMLVKTETWQRKNELAAVAESVENYTLNLKNLIRRDSDINIGVIKIETTNSYMQLENELSTIDQTIDFLKSVFVTSSPEHLYPILKEQATQKERLTEFMDKCVSTYDNLQTLTNHASAVHWKLASTTIDTTAEYNVAKVEIKNKIAEEIDRCKQVQSVIDKRYQLLSNVRISLNHLQLLSRLLSHGKREKMSKKLEENRALVPPKVEQINGEIITPELMELFADLANKSKQLHFGDVYAVGYKQFEIVMRDRSHMERLNVVESEESLVGDVAIDVAVPTRDEIKKRGEEIIAQCLAQMKYIPPPRPKKRYKFKK